MFCIIPEPILKLLVILLQVNKMGQKNSQPKIEGFCDPKFDKVKKQFEKLFTEGIDENAQLCVYVEDKCIIDLYGTYNDEYNANRTQVSHAKCID